MQPAAPKAKDQCVIKLKLVDPAGRLIRDPETRFNFRRQTDNAAFPDPKKLELVEAEIALSLPAFPQQIVYCEIEPTRFRWSNSGFFNIGPGLEHSRTLTIPRDPEKWSAGFTAWNSLGAPFQPLKDLLEKSTAVGLFKNGAPPRVIAGAGFDDLPKDWHLAKACLLNLRHKLSEPDPISQQKPWLSFVDKVLAIGRERMIALAMPELFDVVATIHRDIAEYPAFERTPAENHRGNVPEAFRDRIEKMVSVKTSEDFGNLQLTVSQIRNENRVVLDADIDENGRLLEHIFDVLIRHRLSGGTHPYDIHEILTKDRPNLDLGYRLV
ncbi:MAG: hypothetical protein FJW20_00650 [Acidimicrobiia bacterium]|nr:hypothetical protein [Acidimicrobiia bacterium]